MHIFQCNCFKDRLYCLFCPNLCSKICLFETKNAEEMMEGHMHISGRQTPKDRGCYNSESFGA